MVSSSRRNTHSASAIALLWTLLLTCGDYIDTPVDEGPPYNLKGDYCVRLLRPDKAQSFCAGESLAIVLASKPESYMVNADIYMSVDSGLLWDILNEKEHYKLAQAVCTVKVLIPDSLPRDIWDAVQQKHVKHNISSISNRVMFWVRDYDKGTCADYSDEVFSIVACP
jgi:hypothetical protein